MSDQILPTLGDEEIVTVRTTEKAPSAGEGSDGDTDSDGDDTDSDE